MIEYIEIRNVNREIIGIIDIAQSIIWHAVYFGVGDFEIYAKATPDNLYLLRAGKDTTDTENFRYVTRPDHSSHGEIGIIEKINITDSIQDGKMIIATGRFAKSILERRLIYKLSGKTNKPTVLRGKVEENIRRVVYDNAIKCSFDSRRNIRELELGVLSGIDDVIVDTDGKPAEKQVSYEELLEYTDSVLREYGLRGIIYCDFDNDDKKLKYCIKKGVDRSVDNETGIDPVLFSCDYDNLSSSDYSFDTSTERNTALIGGAGEGVDRFYTLVASNKTGLARRELWVDASSVNRSYKDENDNEKQYTDAEYKGLLDTTGKQTLAPLICEEIFNGTINVSTGNYLLNRDFQLGDIVTVQENSLNLYSNVRITETTEVQDGNGYSVEVKYE